MGQRIPEKEIANFQFICERIKKQKFHQEDIKMVGRIYHVGLTVSDLDRSIAFYRDILGLEFQGEIFMEGEETDKMFRRVNCKAREMCIRDRVHSVQS